MRLFAKIRKFGYKKTFRLIVVKIKSILEVFIHQTFWGEHIGLRSTKSLLTSTEIKQIYNWGRDEEVLKWSGGTRSELSLDAFQNRLHRERWTPQSDQRIFYIVTKTNEFVGQIGLLGIDWEKEEGELGILIDKNYWNKQYGREAVRLLIKYVFTNLPIQRIYLGTFKDNVRAQRSFAASGFRFVGEEKRFLPSMGRVVEGVKMEIARKDFGEQSL